MHTAKQCNTIPYLTIAGQGIDRARVVTTEKEKPGRRLEQEDMGEDQVSEEMADNTRRSTD